MDGSRMPLFRGVGGLAGRGCSPLLSGWSTANVPRRARTGRPRGAGAGRAETRAPPLCMEQSRQMPILFNREVLGLAPVFYLLSYFLALPSCLRRLTDGRHGRTLTGEAAARQRVGGLRRDLDQLTRLGETQLSCTRPSAHDRLRTCQHTKQRMQRRSSQRDHRALCGPPHVNRHDGGGDGVRHQERAPAHAAPEQCDRNGHARVRHHHAGVRHKATRAQREVTTVHQSCTAVLARPIQPASRTSCAAVRPPRSAACQACGNLRVSTHCAAAAVSLDTGSCAGGCCDGCCCCCWAAAAAACRVGRVDGGCAMLLLPRGRLEPHCQHACLGAGTWYGRVLRISSSHAPSSA